MDDGWIQMFVAMLFLLGITACLYVLMAYYSYLGGVGAGSLVGLIVSTVVAAVLVLLIRTNPDRNCTLLRYALLSSVLSFAFALVYISSQLLNRGLADHVVLAAGSLTLGGVIYTLVVLYPLALSLTVLYGLALVAEYACGNVGGER